MRSCAAPVCSTSYSTPSVCRRSRLFCCSVLVGLIALISATHAMDVTLVASDTVGSSFNTAGNWDSGAAPIAGNNYFTSIYTLRTPAATPTFAGDSLTIDTSGTLLIASAGPATVNNLILNGGTIRKTAAGDYSLNGILTVQSASVLSSDLSGAIMRIHTQLTGIGDLSIQGQGITVLRNANGAYTGTITVETGTLVVGSVDCLGSTAVGTVVLPGATLGLSGASSTLPNGSVIDPEPLTLNGNGQGGVGALNMRNGDNTSLTWSGPITLASDSSIGLMDANDTMTLTGSISGAGNLTRIGVNGTLVLSGNNDYTGTTIVNGGPLVVRHANALGSSLSGTIVNDTRRLVLENNIAVSGEPLTITGRGGNFFGALQSGSGTNTWGGTITLGNDDTRVGARNGATLVISGVVGDAGANLPLNIRGESPTGVVELQGVNTYGGRTNVIVGTLRLGIGDDRLPTGSVVVLGNTSNVSDAVFDLNGFNQRIAGLRDVGTTMGRTVTNLSPMTSTLTLSDSVDHSYRGVLAGNLNLVKQGTETQALFGVNTYTGTTTVNGGTLTIETGGSVASNTAVNAGGTLNGTGQITGNVNNHGTVTAGTESNPAGTLTVNGNYMQDGSGTYQVQISSFSSNVLNVTGSATLSGALRVNGSFPRRQQLYEYDVLLAGGGVSGSFDSIDTSLDVTVQYLIDRVHLTIDGVGYSDLGETADQHATGRYLDGTAIPLATGDLADVIAALDALPDAAVPGALDQLHPEMYDVFTRGTFRHAQVLGNALERRLSELRMASDGSDLAGLLLHATEDGPALAANEPMVLPAKKEAQSRPPRFSTWALGQGVGGSVDSAAERTGFEFRSAGAAVGFDGRVDKHLHLGLTVGVSQTDFDLDRAASSAKQNTLQVGPYFSYAGDRFFVDGWVLAGVSDFEARRGIVFPGVARVARGETDGWHLVGSVGAGYVMPFGDWRFGPTVRFTGVHTEVDGFRERNASALNLAVRGWEGDSLRSELGVLASREFRTSWGRVVPQVRARWSHEFGDDERGISSNFADLPGTFTVHSARLGRDSALLGGGLTILVGDQADVYLDYDAGLLDGNVTHAGRAGFRIRF